MKADVFFENSWRYSGCAAEKARQIAKKYRGVMNEIKEELS
jgi:hypothetical protein